MKIAVVFYSTYGHVLRLAEAAAEGAREVPGTEVTVYRIPETLPRDVLEKKGALAAQEAMAGYPAATAASLEGIDGLILASSSQYGMMTAQTKAFLDSTGGLWMSQALEGVPAAYLTSTATLHGGQETSAVTAYAALMHHGMIPVGLPYAWKPQLEIDGVFGGSPYSAGTVTGGTGERMADERELEGARYQGRRLALIAGKLAA